MPSLRGLRLAFSFLGFPTGIGVAAHQLTNYYKSLMDFTNTFFLVQATENLYDTGIPNIPKDVQEAVERILAEKDEQEGKKNGESSQPAKGVRAQNETSTDKKQDEIFGDSKKYWCRYFDYSGGKENVIMQYDPYCTLYNIFEHNKADLTKASSGDSSTNKKQVTVKLSQIVSDTQNLESKKLKSNSEFKKGGFYLLRLDKTRIPKANSSFNIELSVPGDGKRKSKRIYHKKITTVKIQAALTGDPVDDMQFQFSTPLPSSRLIVKKINNDVGNQINSTQPSTAGSSIPENEETSYYFKKTTGDSDKLYVERAWSFGNPTSSSRKKRSAEADLSSKFDLSTIDKAPLEKINGSETSNKQEVGDKHYLFKNVSDFWDYKVGEQIILYKSSKKTTEGQESEGQDQEIQIATFEIVSGALIDFGVSVRCVDKEQESTLKPNLKEDGGLVQKDQARNGFCTPKNGKPEHVLILVGYNENSVQS